MQSRGEQQLKRTQSGSSSSAQRAERANRAKLLVSYNACIHYRIPRECMPAITGGGLHGGWEHGVGLGGGSMGGGAGVILSLPVPKP